MGQAGRRGSVRYHWSELGNNRTPYGPYLLGTFARPSLVLPWNHKSCRAAPSVVENTYNSTAVAQGQHFSSVPCCKKYRVVLTSLDHNPKMA